MVASVSVATPIRPASIANTPSVTAPSPPAPSDTPRSPQVISISREAMEALQKGRVETPPDPATYDRQIKAISAMRLDMIARDAGPDLGAPAASLSDSPHTAPFAAVAQPLFKMVKDTPDAQQDLANALFNALPTEREGTTTTRAADFALMRLKFTTIADRLIVPEHREAATAVFDRMYDMATAAKPVDRQLLAQTMSIANGTGTADERATGIIDRVRAAVGGDTGFDSQHSALMDMTMSWQVFEGSIRGDFRTA